MNLLMQSQRMSGFRAFRPSNARFSPNSPSPASLTAFLLLAQNRLLRLVAAYECYRHQAEMLRRGVRAGEPGIVTSGTGSGKTESFLLPVLAMLAREAVGWPEPHQKYLQRRWWQDVIGRPYPGWKEFPSESKPTKKEPERTPFLPQRRGEKRPAAIRALILYPMNALVEDQMVRIRLALDSEEARRTQDENFHRNRIFFGRYTSVTPVTGFDRHPRREALQDLARRRAKLVNLFREMRELQSTQQHARKQDAPRLQDHPRFQFPSVDGSEMCSRWDMQEHPPDILISNVSMLSAMLAREVEAPIFEKTRTWLLENEDAYFFLVLDELHLTARFGRNRGKLSTEIAFHPIGSHRSRTPPQTANPLLQRIPTHGRSRTRGQCGLPLGCIWPSWNIFRTGKTREHHA